MAQARGFTAQSDNTDLARLANVSASSSHEGDGWSVANANDGILSSITSSLGWSSSDSNTSSNHTEWLQLDFGMQKLFSEVDLYPRSDLPKEGYGFPIDFTIAVSNDATNWTTVVTKTGYALPSGVQNFAFTAQTARYVRVTGTNLRANPNENNSYRLQFAEISVY